MAALRKNGGRRRQAAVPDSCCIRRLFDIAGPDRLRLGCGTRTLRLVRAHPSRSVTSKLLSQGPSLATPGIQSLVVQTMS